MHAVLLVQEVTGEEEPEEAPKAALGGLFGRAKKAAQETTGEPEPEKKPAKALGGLFGRGKRAAEEAIDEIETQPKPKPFAGFLGGTQKVRYLMLSLLPSLKRPAFHGVCHGRCVTTRNSAVCKAMMMLHALSVPHVLSNY